MLRLPAALTHFDLALDSLTLTFGRSERMRHYWLILCLLCVACNPTAPSTNTIQVVTAIPTVDISPTPSPQKIEFLAPESCDAEESTELDEFTPSAMTWITADDAQLVTGSEPFTIYGVNFYPRLAPFNLFLTDSEPDVIAKELEVIIPSGINTLRIFINIKQLFLCESQAIPNADTLSLLDSIISTMTSNGLRLIMVLHQDVKNPNQSTWDQLQFIVTRYREESAIVAWDVLDKGDVLYESSSQEAILTWLSNAIRAIRQVDNRHLITASWQSNPLDTEPLVDMVSFQHFGDYMPLRQGIANIKAATSKPILLSAIGYSTFDMDETAQRNLLFQGIEEVRNNQLAGWAIYMAFDYPTSVTCIDPDCPTKPASLNYFGIWNTSYFPKLAVDAIKRVTESE